MAGFQLKDFVSIVAAQRNYVRATQERVTDLEVGSVARTMLEAPAVEIEELYQKIFNGILDAIPTAIYLAFGFEQIGEAAAKGTVTVQFAAPIEIPFTVPAGTVFDAPGASLKFVSAEAVSVLVGATSAAIVVECQAPGIVGNIGAGAITGTINYTLPVGSSLSNPPFTSGREAQTDAERKARFVEFIQSLSRGTVVAIRYAVRKAQVTSPSGVLLEYVSRVGIGEEAGRVFVYVYGSSGLPSTALLADAQRYVDGTKLDGLGQYEPGYRAAGVEVVVLPMTERLVDVGLQVELMTGYTPSTAISNQIRTQLSAEFDRIEAGQTLYVAQLIDAALTVPGVRRVIVSNNTNELCDINEVLKLGTTTITWIPNA